jgi:hypothetical protein
MANHHLNRVARDLAVEQSLDAAIELNEVLHHKRKDAPALLKLATSLIGTQPDAALSKRELLNNSQLTSLSFRAELSTGKQPSSTQDLSPILDLLVQVAQAGLTNFSQDDLECIRDFCLGLNRELVSEVANRIPEPVVVRASRMRSMAL